MRRFSDLLIASILSVGVVGVAIAETILKPNEFDLLTFLFSPQTGTITVLAVAVVMLWRALRESERYREELHAKRIEDARRATEVLKEQREYHAELREKLHEDQLAARDLLQKNMLVMERLEARFYGID